MRKTDAGEYFDAKQENTFSEYRAFPAEEYYASEMAAPPLEIVPIEESFQDRRAGTARTADADGSDARELQKQCDRISRTQSSVPANAAPSQASGAAASSAAAVSGAAAGAGSVAAAVLIFVVAVAGLFANIGKYISFYTGMDYLTVTVNMEEVLREDTQLRGLSAADFTLEIETDDGGRKIPLLDGKHTYLIAGLQPETAYTYNIVCNHPSLADNPVCHSQTVTTPGHSDPAGVYDEVNNYILYDDETRTATVAYSVYLSDFEDRYATTAFYLCSTEQTDPGHMDHVLLCQDAPDANNFFAGTVTGIVSKELYLYVVGRTDPEAGSTLLFSQKTEVGLPEEWVVTEEFEMPDVALSPAFGFDGTYFTLSYHCDMIYDYADAVMDLEISDGTTVYVKHLDSVSQNGVVVLDHITGEPGTLQVTGSLTFRDDRYGMTRTVGIGTQSYDMRYRFSVSGVFADLSTDGTTIPVTMTFDTLLPESCRISITDPANSIDFTLPLTEAFYFNSIPLDTAAELTVCAIDGEGDPVGQIYTYTVSRADAKENYVSPYMSCVNPGDALVTYNDDGTINIYRRVDFQSDDSRVSYNAFLYGGFSVDPETGRTVYTDCYDLIGRDTFAVIEHIPERQYLLLYHFLFEYNGVCYTMYTEMPSGSIIPEESEIMAEVVPDGGSTNICLLVPSYGDLEDRILCNGTEYRYTIYGALGDSTPTLVLDGEQEVQSVTVFFATQGQNYEAYCNEIPVKGSRYRTYVIETTNVVIEG